MEIDMPHIEVMLLKIQRFVENDAKMLVLHISDLYSLSKVR